ncbi:PREDICTED: uncharacterized protein LOC108564830 [Nicrophorus vespilloides]|uniref:Uncharacterized protein LOC108564830 n=1 Tax=Nicrophorus vespilloides TaxID=110193 RepID=A0ABM1MY26_NICVS|nr:PREDICTED: uncharacterized protein LOC108564830 [Nicrophorus vespilloides]
MASLPKSPTHSYFLVNYMEQTAQYYKIAKFIELVGHAGLTRQLLDESVFVKFPDKTILCNIIMSSNDEDELKVVLANVEKHHISTVKQFEQERPPKAFPKGFKGMYPLMSEDSRRRKMYILGDNGTAIPVGRLSRMLWNDHKTATYDLINIVYTKEMLIAHGMGQMDLNPFQMQDIISIVSDKCKVEKCDVREAIDKHLMDLKMKCRQYF